MGKVRLLDKHTAELIAAGEVVERPSSVIKELVENSIDAGADTVTVETVSGGTVLIRITDNGCGISAEDVPVAFLRHATSKITTGEDLSRIATLGFRGEALASVAAVSRVELLTRTKESMAGTHYIIEGGEEQLNEEAACPVGTTIKVRDIFYNTPARMKFLKKDVTESNACATVLDRLALSHPEVSITYIRDGKEVLRTPGDGELKSAIHAVYGRQFTSSLIPVEYSYNGLTVTGYVSKPVEARSNRSMQIFFINNRFVRSKTMQAALEEACRGAVMVGKFPACVLNIDMSFDAVDVNVHPAKLEVRFANEKPIFEVVYYGVKTALADKDERKEMHIPERKATPVKPNGITQAGRPAQTAFWDKLPAAPQAKPTVEEADIKPAQPEQIITTEAPLVNTAVAPPEQTEITLADSGYSAAPVADIIPPVTPPVHRVNIDIFPEHDEAVAEKTHEQTLVEPIKENNFTMPDYRIIGEVFDTYIIIQCGDEIIYIDKHAAHERLKYKNLIDRMEDPDSQLLLTPVAVTLEKTQYGALLENDEMLSKAGFEIEDFGPGTVLVRAIPTILADCDIAGAVQEIAGNIGNKADATITAKTQRMFQTIACKSAVRAGDKSSPEELAQLVLMLRENPDVRYCPHGRPIWIALKRSELESSFGRA